MGAIELLQLIGAAADIAKELGVADKIIADMRVQGRHTATEAETSILKVQAPTIHEAASKQAMMARVLGAPP
jgi:hypothetical protein